MAVYGKIATLPTSEDAPPDDDPSTPSTTGGDRGKEQPSKPSHSTSSTVSKTGASLGAASLLGSKDDFLFSVANSPTRKREFGLGELD